MPEIITDQISVENQPTTDKHVLVRQYQTGIFIYHFRLDSGLAANLNNYPLKDALGMFSYETIPAPGYFIKSQIILSSPRTAGSLTLKYRRTRSGTPSIIVSSGTSLDLVIDGSNTQYNENAVNEDIAEYAMQKDDLIEPVITTDSAWTPADANIKVVLYFLLKTFV